MRSPTFRYGIQRPRPNDANTRYGLSLPCDSIANATSGPLGRLAMLDFLQEQLSALYAEEDERQADFDAKVQSLKAEVEKLEKRHRGD